MSNSERETYEAVDLTELKEGDRIVIDFSPSGPKMGTVTEVEKVVVPAKVEGDTYHASFTQTIISAVSDQGSPCEIAENIIRKITHNMK